MYIYNLWLKGWVKAKIQNDLHRSFLLGGNGLSDYSSGIKPEIDSIGCRIFQLLFQQYFHAIGGAFIVNNATHICLAPFYKMIDYIIDNEE